MEVHAEGLGNGSDERKTEPRGQLGKNREVVEVSATPMSHVPLWASSWTSSMQVLCLSDQIFIPRTRRSLLQGKHARL